MSIIEKIQWFLIRRVSVCGYSFGWLSGSEFALFKRGKGLIFNFTYFARACGL